MKTDWKAIWSALKSEAIVIAKSPEAIKLTVKGVHAVAAAIETASITSPLLVTVEQLLVTTLVNKLESQLPAA